MALMDSRKGPFTGKRPGRHGTSWTAWAYHPGIPESSQQMPRCSQIVDFVHCEHRASYSHLTVHLRRILEQVAGLRSARNATLLRAADAVVRGESGIEELGASLKGLRGNESKKLTTDVEEHFLMSSQNQQVGKLFR